MTDQSTSSGQKRLAMVLAGGVAGVIDRAGAVYGIGHPHAQRWGESGLPRGRPGRESGPAREGHVAAVKVAKSPLRCRHRLFSTPGRQAGDARRLQGAHVLVNLWAT